MGIRVLIPFTRYALERNDLGCPLCGSTHATPISHLDRRLKFLVHAKCDDCGLVRQFPLPTAQALKKYYQEDYRSDYQGQSAAPTQKHITKRLRESEVRLNHLAPLVPKGGELLDVGCGSGEFLVVANAREYKAAGVEPGQGYATYAREALGLNVTSTDWLTFNTDQKFDAITSFHVFEHLIDPVTSFKKMTMLLKPGGYIYLETPNIRNALQKGFGCLHIAHTLGFTRYTMELLAARCSFRVVKLIDEYDIGMVFQRGEGRPSSEIMRDGVAELAQWNKREVHRQFWRYTFRKLKV